MSDVRSDLVSGPDQYWSDRHPVSRGQWKSIAAAACEVLDIPIPKTRYDATVTLVRLREASERRVAAGGPVEVPETPW
ncbi:MAG TPA: hypothetical protein VFS37_09005 [Conexibacter sp.]|nr:hypothetical protein [Conexibacter sp.]